MPCLCRDFKWRACTVRPCGQKMLQTERKLPFGKEDTMHNMIRKSTVYFLVAALVLIPLAGTVMAEDAYEKEPISSEAMAADLLIVRPIGIISMIAGTFLFVFSLPFSFSEKNMEGNRQEIGKTLDSLIVEPSKYTFNRRLGDL